jgi:hypothetical protein
MRKMNKKTNKQKQMMKVERGKEQERERKSRQFSHNFIFLLLAPSSEELSLHSHSVDLVPVDSLKTGHVHVGQVVSLVGGRLLCGCRSG